MSKINLFISYSHDDETYFRRLKQFINCTNCPNLNIWDDEDIQPGEEWDEEIKRKLNEAHIILLLISQDFLNSKYINEIELKSALKKHELNQCRVIPIFVKECILNIHPQITKLQGLPKGMKFLANMGEQVDSLYTEIYKEIIEVAEELLTDENIRNSISKNDAKSDNAKAIEDLRNKKEIFLSVPDSEEGRKKRKAFIIQVDGKIKYESWPYEIVPSIKDTEELITKSPDEIVTACKAYITSALYSIHIITSETDLVPTDNTSEKQVNKLQYDLSKSEHVNSIFHKRIVWLLSADLKPKLDKEISMDPLFTGNDYECMFDLIKSLDSEKEKKINELKKDFSPNKKVIMFYDFKKDHNSDLRIKLKTRIEENKKISVFPNMPNGTLSTEREELDKCDGALIFYGASDPEWVLMHQSILIGSSAKRPKAICIDEPEINLKIKRDVSINEFITISGNNEFEDGVQNFLDKLKY